MADFLKAHAFTESWEGGLDDNPNDSGGITKYGVCIEFLKDLAASETGRRHLEQCGVSLPIVKNSVRTLRMEQARDLFRLEFWEPLRCAELPQRVAAVLYDCAVNHGSKQAVIFCQTGNNAANPENQIAVDGKLGPKTRAALMDCDNACSLSAIIDERVDFYKRLASRRPKDRVFLKGWLNRAESLRAFVGAVTK